MNPRMTLVLGLLTVILFTAALGGDLYGGDKPKEKPLPKTDEKPAPKADKKPGDKPAKSAPKGTGKKPAAKPAKPAPKGTGKKPAAKPAKPAPKGTGKKPAAKPAEPSPGKTVKPPPKKPAEPPKPAFEPRDVPEPLVPELDDVPPGFQPETWQSWATGQKITTPGRFTFNIVIGISLLQNDGMAGNGTDAPSYSDLFHDDPSPMAGFELGFTLMPILNISAGYTYTYLDGQEAWQEDGGVPTGWEEAYWDDLEVHAFSLSIKIKIPLLVWKLSSTHLRFSQASEITGPVFFVRTGVGGSILGGVSAELMRWTPFEESQEMEYYEENFNFSWNAGAGIEIRWDWGGVLLQFTMSNHGTPVPIVPMAESEAVSTLGFVLGFGLYL